MAAGGTQGGIASGSHLAPGMDGDLIKSGQGSNTGKMQPSANIGRLQVRGVRISGRALRVFFFVSSLTNAVERRST